MINFIIHPLKCTTMSSVKIGKVKSGKSRSNYDVYWDAKTSKVYTHDFHLSFKKEVGKAKSAADAMRVAEAAVYDK